MRPRPNTHKNTSRSQYRRKKDYIQIRTVCYQFGGPRGYSPYVSHKLRRTQSKKELENSANSFFFRTQLQWLKNSNSRKQLVQDAQTNNSTFYSNIKPSTANTSDPMRWTYIQNSASKHKTTHSQSTPFNIKNHTNTMKVHKENSLKGRAKRMPFYFNFVDDRILRRIPKLSKHIINKLPGFRAKINPRTKLVIPHEKEIKATYMMNIPVCVEKLENPNSTIHLLEKPWPGIRKIKDIIRCFKNDKKNVQCEKHKIKEGLKQFSSKLNKELDNMKSHFMTEFKRSWGLLKLDKLNHQNNKMKLHKEVRRLKRDDNTLIKNIENEHRRIYSIEDDLFKNQVFLLNCKNKEEVNLEANILRRLHNKLPQYEPIAKLSNGFIPEDSIKL